MSLLKLKQQAASFFEPKLPPVALEIAPDCLAAVRVSVKAPRSLERYAVMPLPAGLVVPSLVQPNISSAGEFLNIVRAALAKAEIKSNRISVAIPDASVKVTIHHLDKLPGNESERQQLLKWRLKKTIPFNVEDFQLAYLQQSAESGGSLVLTVNVHKEVQAQFESLFQSLGMHAGYITPSSFAAFELLSRLNGQSPCKSLLFLKAGWGGITAVMSHQNAIAFFRHVGAAEASLHASATPLPMDSAEELYNEIHPCLMYYQDKLEETGVQRIFVLCPQDLDKSRLKWLSEKTGRIVVNFDPLQALGPQLNSIQQSQKNSLASALGLALGGS